MPVAGEVIAINTQLAETPDMINDDPYNGGWMLEVLISDPAALQTLTPPDVYLKQIGEMA